MTAGARDLMAALRASVAEAKRAREARQAGTGNPTLAYDMRAAEAACAACNGSCGACPYVAGNSTPDH